MSNTTDRAEAAKAAAPARLFVACDDTGYFPGSGVASLKENADFFASKHPRFPFVVEYAKVTPLPAAPAPDAVREAKERVVETAKAEHLMRYGPDGDYKVAISDAEQATENAVIALLAIEQGQVVTLETPTPTAAFQTCAEPGCKAMGLTASGTWRCAIHHPDLRTEHP